MTDTAMPAPPPIPVMPAETLQFEFVQRPGLLKIALVNFFLSLITLGFYRFWGKTTIRQHIWSSVHINGEPLEYTGTGMELFKGFLVVLFALILPFAVVVAAISVFAGPQSPWVIIVQMVSLLLVQVFWGYALYKARKYQLSRTNWRGIRGTMVGSAMTYSLTYFGSMLAKGMSLGWATPVMNTLLQEQITNDMRFGDAAFKFKGRAGPLYPTYAMCWLLTLAAIVALPILLATGAAGIDFSNLDTFFKDMDQSGPDASASKYLWWFGIAFAVFLLATMLLIPMLWAIYTAKELRTFANYTRFDGAQFALNATTGSVIWLAVINLLIIILTFGIGTPFAMRRTVRFIIDRLSLSGAVEIDRIRQSTVAMESRGEGLADAFDVGGL